MERMDANWILCHFQHFVSSFVADAMAKAETKGSTSSRTTALGKKAKLLKGQQLLNLKPILKAPKNTAAVNVEGKKKKEKKEKDHKKVKKTIEKAPKTAEGKTEKQEKKEKKDKEKHKDGKSKTEKQKKENSQNKGKEKKAKPEEKPVANPTTPPAKRVRFKSPPSVESDTDATIKKILKNQARAALKARDGLEEALSDAEIKAMLDGAGIEGYLDYIHGGSTQTASEALEPKPPVEKPKARDPKAESNAALAKRLLALKAMPPPASDSEAGSEAEESEAEAEQSEEDAEEAGASGSEELQSEEESVEPCPSDQDGSDAEAPEASDPESAESSEQEESDADDPEPAVKEPKAEPKAVPKVAPKQPEPEAPKKVEEKAGAELNKAAGETVDLAKTVRNSVTHKQEWDKYVRQVGNRNIFPAKLAPAFAKSKVDLFGLWLDSGMDWEKTTLLAERKRLTRNLSRNQLTAVQAKDLYKQKGEEKAKTLIAMREKEGMWYRDDDFPEDPME